MHGVRWSWLPPLAIVYTTLVGGVAVQAEDWPQFLGPYRNNTSLETIAPWTGELKVAWRQPVGEGHGGPAVAMGKVFVHAKVQGKEEEELTARSAEDGKEIWRKSYERGAFTNVFGNGPRSTPLVDGDRVYTLGATGILTCWDVNDGAERWRRNLLKDFQARNLFFGISTTPIIRGDKLIVMVGSETAGIVALDKNSGNLLWKSGKDKASYSSPIVTEWNGEAAAVFLTGQGIVALDVETGDERARFPLVDKLMESSATPVRMGDLLWGSSVTFGSVMLRMETPPQFTQAWKSDQLTSYFATPVVVGNEFYLVTGSVITRSANLHCVDVATGKILWTRKNVGRDHATVMKVGEHLLLLEEMGQLALLRPDAREYVELARARVCGQTWAHPALSNGRLFVRDGKELSCLELPRGK